MPLRTETRIRFGNSSVRGALMLWTRTTMRSERSRSSRTSTNPVISTFQAAACRTGWAMTTRLTVAVAKPAAIVAKASINGKATGRRRARMDPTTVAASTASAAQSSGSRAAAKYRMVPKPNVIASQGTSRPGPTSASAHCRRRSAKRCRNHVTQSGQAHAGRHPAPAGCQTPTRPRARSSSAIARFPRTPAILWPQCYTIRVWGKGGATTNHNASGFSPPPPSPTYHAAPRSG